ncbi:alanine--glyoxylate aminotransferase family protein [Synechococcus sp. PCC 7336]|uniref:pyridoxal-phosphate-dependent aminotransferase family protein n=1 Tax=Synechococcus sp. PCC 7336 TaxID=195250 RepID=UPI00034851D6|nr:alanine--glyoxylate aminotransferase family protein [Synechococcus sp. PCC 7336]
MTATLAINNRHQLSLDPLKMPERLLLGPGPSNADPAVLNAMTTRQVSHLDPEFLARMSEIQSLLRYVWQTENQLTIPISGTGSAAMEATLANSVEPGDRVLVGVNGYFGLRLVDMAGRYGAEVQTIQRPWGETFTLAEIRQGLEQHRPAILALVHAETSTGACQSLDGVGDLCREFDCLLLVDTVTSMGGVPLYIDDWGIDLAYSCSQKCLSCPPGISPFTMGPRAIEKLNRRSSQVANWYLDMSLVSKYWGNDRTYHHTAPISMTYALREGLRLIADEGLAARWKRHRDTAEYLWSGLTEIGLDCYVERQDRLPTLTTVRIPDGVDGKAVFLKLLNEDNIEIGNGLGDLTGRVWRIGLMGANSSRENVDRVLEALPRAIAAV